MPVIATTTFTIRRFHAPANATTAMQLNARLEEYRLLQQRLGTTRSVVVLPGRASLVELYGGHGFYTGAGSHGDTRSAGDRASRAWIEYREAVDAGHG